MKKIGASHIEIILAFVLFIGVVGFALYFLNPINPDRLTDVTMDYIYREISKNVSVGVESFSVEVTTRDEIITVDLGESANGMKSRVENLNGDRINSRVVGNDVEVDGTELNADDFILIKLSEDIEESELPSGDLGGSYQITSSNYEKVFSEKKILELNKSYYKDYFGLKEDFNIPARTDFGFEFVFNDLPVLAQRDVPAGLEVFSESKRVEVLNKEGEMVFANFIINLW